MTSPPEKMHPTDESENPYHLSQHFLICHKEEVQNHDSYYKYCEKTVQYALVPFHPHIVIPCRLLGRDFLF